MNSARRLRYCLGDLTSSVPLTVISFFQLYFLTDVARLAPAAAGWSIAVAKLWDAVNDPLLGVLSDRLSTRWGRRRGPLLIAALPLGLSFTLLWVVPPLGQTALAVYYAAAFILFDTAFTLYHVSYNALTPEMAPDYDERSSLNGLRMVFSIGGALAAVIVLTLLGSLVPEPRARFALAGAVLGLASALPPIAVFGATRGLDLPSAAPRTSSPALADVKAVLANKPFRQVLLIYLLSWTTATLISGILVYFAAYYLRAPSQANYLVLVAEGAAIAFIPLVVFLCKKWDKRKAFLAGVAAWIAVQAGIALVPADAIWAAYALAALMGFGIATAYVVPWAMLPDAIDADRAASGERREGAHYAFASFFQKLGTGAALWLVAQALARAGYVTPTAAVPYPEQPAGAVTALRYAIGLAPAVLLSGAAAIALGYRMNRGEQREAAALLVKPEGG